MTQKLSYVIAISGKFGSGKTSAAKLITSVDPRWRIHRFAGALKQAAATALGITVEDLDRPEIKVLARPLLQALGQAARELHGDDYWVKQAAAAAIASGDRYIIVDDMRILDE